MAEASDRVVADRYLLHEAVGRGGMGVVWRADDRLLGRHVAVKEVHLQPGLDAAERDAVQERVLREARAAAMLNHAGAVTVFDVAQQDGRAYIVMELVEAPTLADLVRDEGPLPPERAAQIGLAVLDVLVAAHARGIVHRDLKPANVMVAGDRVKLTDFGIATVKDDPRLTSTGIVLGSPSYIAPEQARGEPVTPATDLWGLGATLFYAVTGRPPFDRGDAIATLTAVAHDELDLGTAAGPLTPVLAAMLAKDPAARPPVADLRARLTAVAAGANATMELPAVPAAPPAPPPEPAAAVPPAATRVPTLARPALPPRPPVVEEVFREEEAPERRRSRAPYVLLALLLLGATLFVVRAATTDTPRRDARTGTTAGDDTRDDDEPAGSAAPEASRATGGTGTGSGTGSGSGGNGVGAGAAPAAASADLATYRHPEAGYTVAYPRGWEQVPRDRWTLDFREPGTGRYLRVGWTNDPGDSAEQAWRDLSRSFGSRHEGYEELRIEPVKYRGFDAAIWEYRYRSGTRTLHAANLGFVSGADRGFALNLQTREEDWAGSQELFRRITESFRTP
jgi:hypothetical protein